mmetsp:Transcript_29723/g.36882  ORF Transcript_29723/g.36882 Transcript_29723/m.36882 type:complete len:238 (-) Transcript_29723:584-1297(-)
MHTALPRAADTAWSIHIGTLFSLAGENLLESGVRSGLATVFDAGTSPTRSIRWVKGSMPITLARGWRKPVMLVSEFAVHLRGVAAKSIGGLTAHRGDGLRSNLLVAKEVLHVADLRLEFGTSLLADLHGILSLASLGHLVHLRPVALGDQTLEDQLAVDEARLTCDGGTAIAVQRGKECALAIDRCLRRRMVECFQILHDALIALTALDADRTLGDCRKHLIKFEDLGDVLLHAHAA